MERYGLVGSKATHNGKTYMFVTRIQEISLYVRDGSYVEKDSTNSISVIGTISDIENYINKRRRTLTRHLP